MSYTWSHNGITQLEDTLANVAFINDKISFAIEKYKIKELRLNYAIYVIIALSPLSSAVDIAIRAKRQASETDCAGDENDTFSIIHMTIGCIVLGLLKLKERYLDYPSYIADCRIAKYRYEDLEHKIKINIKDRHNKIMPESEYLQNIYDEFKTLSMIHLPITVDLELAFLEYCRSNNKPIPKSSLDKLNLQTGNIDSRTPENNEEIQIVINNNAEKELHNIYEKELD